MDITVITLFPEAFPGILGVSVLGKALKKGIWKLRVVNLRDHGIGPHHTVDEPVYGGGSGMLIRPDVVHNALLSILSHLENPLLLYMSPRGERVTQPLFKQMTEQSSLVILCGRYEGVDARVLDWWKFREISLGDFVLCGGEVAAMAFIEGCVRLLPTVVGKEASVQMESFQEPLLEHEHYTRPYCWNEMTVPKVLTSGNHGCIAAWRKQMSVNATLQKRPDLWKQHIQEET